MSASIDILLAKMANAALVAACTDRGQVEAALDEMTRREGRFRRRLCSEAGKLGLTNDGDIIRAIEEAVEI